MRNNLRLYHTVLQELSQWLPGEHISRKRNLALLVVGVYLSASVYLGRIVSRWPLAGKAPSLAGVSTQLCRRTKLWSLFHSLSPSVSM